MQRGHIVCGWPKLDWKATCWPLTLSFSFSGSRVSPTSNSMSPVASHPPAYADGKLSLSDPNDKRTVRCRSLVSKHFLHFDAWQTKGPAAVHLVNKTICRFVMHQIRITYLVQRNDRRWQPHQKGGAKLIRINPRLSRDTQLVASRRAKSEAPSPAAIAPVSHLKTLDGNERQWAGLSTTDGSSIGFMTNKCKYVFLLLECRFCFTWWWWCDEMMMCQCGYRPFAGRTWDVKVTCIHTRRKHDDTWALETTAFGNHVSLLLLDTDSSINK